MSDYLGNTRVLYADLNKDGRVDGSEILQENHYYPFGMNMEGSWCIDAVNTPKNHYQFNGIERFEDLDLKIDFAFYRSYDAAIGRWWQVDPKAEDYVGMSVYTGMGNNPVMMSDPNGDAIPSAILGAGIGVVMNGLNNLVQGNDFFQGVGKAALFGALGGAISSGIGDFFSGMNGLGTELLRAGTHGISGGFQSNLAGGSFGSGFLSGAFSSGVGSAIGKSGLSGIGAQIVGGGVSGGVGSMLGGGSFVAGATNGILVGALNHAAHLGALGEGFAASLATGQIRHIFYSDAVGIALEGTAYGGLAPGTGTSGEGVLIKGGINKGEVILAIDLAVGLGPDVSASIVGTNYYYSGKLNTLEASFFTGHYTKVNFAFTAGIDFGLAISKTHRLKNNNFILGVHKSIGVGAPVIPSPFSISIEKGYTGISRY